MTTLFVKLQYFTYDLYDHALIAIVETGEKMSESYIDYIVRTYTPRSAQIPPLLNAKDISGYITFVATHLRTKVYVVLRKSTRNKDYQINAVPETSFNSLYVGYKVVCGIRRIF